MEAELEGMCAQLSEVAVGTSGLQGELQDLRSKLEAVEQKNVGLMMKHEELLQEHSLCLSELKISHRDAHTISADTVKEYRLSTNCQDRKGRYASGLLKYGFYLARTYLESQLSGETFPELTAEVEESTQVDWR